MTWNIHVSVRAEDDIDAVLDWTLANFGERKYDEYRDLIREALVDIARSPEDVRVRHRPDIHEDFYTLHLAGPGRAARHFFLFRILADEMTVIVDRLLYDGMEITRHLPESYH